MKHQLSTPNLSLLMSRCILGFEDICIWGANFGGGTARYCVYPVGRWPFFLCIGWCSIQWALNLCSLGLSDELSYSSVWGHRRHLTNESLCLIRQCSAKSRTSCPHLKHLSPIWNNIRIGAFWKSLTKTKVRTLEYTATPHYNTSPHTTPDIHTGFYWYNWPLIRIGK